MVDAALTFKILRLAPPALDLTLRSTFDLAADTAPEDADPSSAPPVEVDPSAAPYARRVQLAGGRAGGGVSASLLIPQAFGQAYIGQLITFAVVVTNTSAYTLHRVGLRVRAASSLLAPRSSLFALRRPGTLPPVAPQPAHPRLPRRMPPRPLRRWSSTGSAARPSSWTPCPPPRSPCCARGSSRRRWCRTTSESSARTP